MNFGIVAKVIFMRKHPNYFKKALTHATSSEILKKRIFETIPLLARY